MSERFSQRWPGWLKSFSNQISINSLSLCQRKDDHGREGRSRQVQEISKYGHRFENARQFGIRSGEPVYFPPRDFLSFDFNASDSFFNSIKTFLRHV
jgi:hypothetical protein